MRLAISSQNYDSFTRPLPISTVKPVADEKNKLPLPQIETLVSAMDQTNPRPVGQTQQLPSTLPTSVEAVNLVAPNIQVWSEEIKDKIDQERLKTLRMVKLQRKAQQLNNQNEVDAKPDQAASRKRPKVKETPGKKKRGGEQTVED